MSLIEDLSSDTSVNPEDLQANSEEIEDNWLDAFIRDAIDSRVSAGLYIKNNEPRYDAEEINIQLEEPLEGKPPQEMEGESNKQMCEGYGCDYCARIWCRPKACIEWSAELVHESDDVLTYSVDVR